MKKKFLLYHIIYIAFFSVSFGQNLNLEIVGESEIENKQIDSVSYKKSHPDFNSAKTETDSLLSNLISLGYLESKLKNIEKVNDSTLLSSLSLGRKYKNLTVYFDKNYFSKSEISTFATKFNDTSFTIPIQITKSVLSYLNNSITKKGYPFASIKLSNIKVGFDNNVFSSLIIDLNGSQRRIDKIVIRGYEKFPKSYIKHFLKIKEGDIFTINSIQKKTSKLKNLRFASEIKTPEALFKNDSTTLYLYLEKTNSNTFDGFLGFGTNQETNKIEFDGYLNLNLNNNLNYGESLSLYYKSDENKQRTFDVRISMPYLFKTPLGVELGLNIFKKDTLFTTSSQRANVYYQLNSKNRFSIGIEGIQSNKISNSEILSSFEDYKTNSYSIGYIYLLNNQTNLYLFPVKSTIQTSFGFGNRKIDDESQPQSNAYINLQHLIELNEKNYIFLRLQGSGIFSDNYYVNELLRFGGLNSIRGFEENSLTATSYGLINAEYRYLLSKGIYAHTITDFSYLDNQIASLKEKLYSFGFGFGIMTQAGVLRIIYANGKAENQNFSLSNSKVHISFNTFF